MDQAYTDEQGNRLRFQPSHALMAAMPPEWQQEHLRWCAEFFGVEDND